LKGRGFSRAAERLQKLGFSPAVYADDSFRALCRSERPSARL
jgi:hypothetical protein